MGKRVLQICPHDIAPFGPLCERYAEAVALLDAEMTTVYLAPPTHAARVGADYLELGDLSNNRIIAAALNRYADVSWDLIICHRYRAYWGVVKSRLEASQVVAVAHDYGMLARWQRRLNRRLFAGHIKFAGVAEDVSRELADVVGQARTLLNPLDVDHQSLLDRVEARERLGVPADVPLVGYVGRLHYKKRPSLALQAFQIFAERHPDAHLVMLGDGEEMGRLAAQAGDHVHLLGFREDAPTLYAAFDVLLHTARKEAFGMVVLEAMFAGVPVVTQRRFGPEHVLGDLGVYAVGDNAVAHAAALERALGVDRAALAARSRQRVLEEFSAAALSRALRDYF